MKAKRCGVAATLGGVAIAWLCLASGDGGFATQSAEATSAPGSATGDSPTQSWSKAEFEVWLPRALAGDPRAAFMLGRSYAEGTSHREDFGEAARWFRKAAEAGHGPAQAGLARLYGKGLGVPQDYVWSYAWFAAAAENLARGSAREQTLELRDMMAAFLSPDQLLRAQRLAEQLKRIGAP